MPQRPAADQPRRVCGGPRAGGRRWLWTTKVAACETTRAGSLGWWDQPHITAANRQGRHCSGAGAQLECLSDIGQRIARGPARPRILAVVAERIPAAFQYPDLCLGPANRKFGRGCHRTGAAEALQQPPPDCAEPAPCTGRRADCVSPIARNAISSTRKAPSWATWPGASAATSKTAACSSRHRQPSPRLRPPTAATSRPVAVLFPATNRSPPGGLCLRAGWCDRRVLPSKGGEMPVPSWTGSETCGPCPTCGVRRWRQGVNAAAPARSRRATSPLIQATAATAPCFQRAGLAVPIVLRGQPIGVLGIENPDATGRWSDEEGHTVGRGRPPVGPRPRKCPPLRGDPTARRARAVDHRHYRADSGRSTDMLGVLETLPRAGARPWAPSRVLVRLAPMSESTPLEPGDGGQESAFWASEASHAILFRGP